MARAPRVLLSESLRESGGNGRAGEQAFGRAERFATSAGVDDSQAGIDRRGERPHFCACEDTGEWAAIAIRLDRAGDRLRAPVGNAVGCVHRGDWRKLRRCVSDVATRIVRKEAFQLDDIRAGRECLRFVVERGEADGERLLGPADDFVEEEHLALRTRGRGSSCTARARMRGFREVTIFGVSRQTARLFGSGERLLAHVGEKEMFG